MFLEVYAVSRNNYTKDTDDSRKAENRRLIEMTGVRIRSSDKFEDRAEVILAGGEVLLAAGSYEDLVKRLLAAAKTSHVARI